MTDKVDFGYERVAPEEKAARVRSVFDRVAPSYDLMNDLMSLGIHRVWKRYFVGTSGVKRGDRAEDLADELLLLLDRHLAEAEMGGLLVFVHGADYRTGGGGAACG